LDAVSTLAGPSAIVAGIAAVAAGLLLAAFFATGRDAIGRANDAASAAMAVLLVPPALAMNALYADGGPLVTALTVVGLAALVETALASILTAAGRLSVRQLMIWQGGGFVAVFGWLVGVSLVVLWLGRLPVLLGYLGLAMAVLFAVGLITFARLAQQLGGWSQLGSMTKVPLVPAISMAGAFVILPIWCIVLGLSL
jgi:hypothetical protein